LIRGDAVKFENGLLDLVEEFLGACDDERVACPVNLNRERLTAAGSGLLEGVDHRGANARRRGILECEDADLNAPLIALVLDGLGKGADLEECPLVRSDNERSTRIITEYQHRSFTLPAVLPAVEIAYRACNITWFSVTDCDNLGFRIFNELCPVDLGNDRADSFQIAPGCKDDKRVGFAFSGDSRKILIADQNRWRRKLVVPAVLLARLLACFITTKTAFKGCPEPLIERASHTRSVGVFESENSELAGCVVFLAVKGTKQRHDVVPLARVGADDERIGCRVWNNRDAAGLRGCRSNSEWAKEHIERLGDLRRVGKLKRYKLGAELDIPRRV